MRLFLDNPEQRFYVRELTRLTDSLINSVRRELTNLIDLKFVLVDERVVAEEAVAGIESGEDKPIDKKVSDSEEKKFNAKKFYYLNPQNIFQQDLLNLFSKGKILVERKFLERIKRLGEVKLIVLAGVFVEDEHAKTDLLIVGNLNKEKAVEALSAFEKEVGKEIRYTIIDDIEFLLRKDMADHFLMDILDNNKNIVAYDSLKNN